MPRIHANRILDSSWVQQDVFKSKDRNVHANGKQVEEGYLGDCFQIHSKYTRKYTKNEQLFRQIFRILLLIGSVGTLRSSKMVKRLNKDHASVRFFHEGSIAPIAPVTTPPVKLEAVTEIKSIREISTNQPTNTLILLDIDRTLIKPPYSNGMGSEAWRKYVVEALPRLKHHIVGADCHDNEYISNIHDLFTHYIANNVPYVAVEDQTVSFVQELQAKGYSVLCLTKRQRDMWYETKISEIDEMTVHQLKHVGLEFKPSGFSYLDERPEYHGGVLFSPKEKGEFLVDLLKDQENLPGKIIFVDDQKAQAHSVSKALDETTVPFESFWLNPSTESEVPFDFRVANYQLYLLLKDNFLLSVDEAKVVIETEDQNDAPDYLLESVKLIAKKYNGD